MRVVRVSPRGQITLPRMLREAVGAEPGRHLLAYAEGNRIVLDVLPPGRSILELSGILPHRGESDVESAALRRRATVGANTLLGETLRVTRPNLARETGRGWSLSWSRYSSAG